MTTPRVGPANTPLRTAMRVSRDRGAGQKAHWSLPEFWKQPLLMAVILAAIVVMARIGLGSVARVTFVLTGVSCGYYYVRRSPWKYITITFWFWTLAPLARRLIDFSAGFDNAALLLGTPNILAFFMVKDIITSRDLLRRRESLVGLLLLLPVCYGLMVSLVQGDVTPGLVAAADWLAPLLYYFYFICNWRRIGEADVVFQNFISANAAVMIVYGIVQFFSPSPWDAAWVINSGLTTIGTPVPYGLRIFGTLNSPGIYAIWLSTLMLLLLHFRSKVSILLAPVGALVLMLTLVRVAAGSVVLGLLLAGIMGRGAILKYLGVGLLATVVILAGVAAIDPEVTDIVTKRFSTVEDLGTDNSALDRAALYRMAPGLISAAPLGMGIGALGRGAVASQHQDFVSIDSGPIVIYLALGWVAGSVYLLGVVLVTVQGLIAARVSGSSAALALSIAAAAATAILPFANLGGFLAVSLWTCAAYAAVLGIAAREQLSMRKPMVENGRYREMATRAASSLSA